MPIRQGGRIREGGECFDGMLAARAVLLKECKPVENRVLPLSRRDARAHTLHHATIDGDPVLRGKRDLLLSISDVGEALAGILLIEMPDPDMLRLRSSAKGGWEA